MSRKKKKKSLEDVCFPIPENFSLTTKEPATIESNTVVKKSLFHQTIKTAYQIKIPFQFTSEYDPTPPYALVSEEEVETVVSLFQALQPRDAIEAALAQQFIIVHLQAIKSAQKGVGELEIKKFELSHQILESLQKFRTKGAQLINVQYNVNQGQVFNSSKVNIKAGKSKEQEPITIEG